MQTHVGNVKQNIQTGRRRAHATSPRVFSPFNLYSTRKSNRNQNNDIIILLRNDV